MKKRASVLNQHELAFSDPLPTIKLNLQNLEDMIPRNPSVKYVSCRRIKVMKVAKSFVKFFISVNS